MQTDWQWDCERLRAQLTKWPVMIAWKLQQLKSSIDTHHWIYCIFLHVHFPKFPEFSPKNSRNFGNYKSRKFLNFRIPELKQLISLFSRCHSLHFPDWSGACVLVWMFLNKFLLGNCNVCFITFFNFCCVLSRTCNSSRIQSFPGESNFPGSSLSRKMITEW